MIPGIQIQIHATIGRILATEGAANVVTARLHWRTVTGRPADYDPQDESTAADEDTVVTDHTLEFRTFFHRVDHRLSTFQRFMEVETGSVILDYQADLALEGKEDVRIEIDGHFYVQKQASTGLLEAWDLHHGHSGTLRTLLLIPAK